MAQTITCPHCGHHVEDAAFCTNCGLSLGNAAGLGSSAAKSPEATAPEAAAAAGRFSRRLPRTGRGLRLLPVSVTGGRIYRWIIALGVLLVLLLLLGGNTGVAIIVATAILPLLFVSYLYAIDLYEDESRLGLLIAAIWGGLVGVGIGSANAWLVGKLWIKHGMLHVGAAGFGSRFADAAGLPPVSIFFLTGIALPVIALALLAFGPTVLRRFPSFRNEVMDGMTVGAAAGGGFAIATTGVYFWPLIAHSVNPGFDVGEWTAILVGLALLRPLILMVIVAIVCAGIWRLDRASQTAEQRLPIAIGLGAMVVYSLGDLFVQPSGARAELVWLLIMAVLVWFAFRLIVAGGLADDRRMLAGRNLVVCPNCRKLTPPGAFCVACGKPLTTMAEPTPATAIVAPSPVTAEPMPEPAPHLEPNEAVEVAAEPAKRAAEETGTPEAPPVVMAPVATSAETSEIERLPDEPAAAEPPEPNGAEAPAAEPSPVRRSPSLPTWLLTNEEPPRQDDDTDKSSS